MTKREKTIIGIMTATVIGGGIHFFMPSNEAAPLVQAAVDSNLKVLVAQVQDGMNQPKLTEREEHILAGAASPWEREPFPDRLLKPVDEEPAATQPEPVELPAYTAFIVVGAETLAIIDGLEYRQEQSLKGGEYRVAGIFPQHVELVRQGALDPVLIRLEDERQNYQE